MMQNKGLLLGKQTPVVEVYSPELLYPIERAIARGSLGIQSGLPFHGVDLWHAYELSWLDTGGRPVARVGRFFVTASSPSIVESKSFKLYLNSLNNTCFESDAAARDCMVRDISGVVGADVTLELYDVDSPKLAGRPVQGLCLDDTSTAIAASEPSASQLQVNSGEIREEQLFSHLLRSLCPVTGQPDWATLWIHYKGQVIEHRSLLEYIISYRQHQEYHEQCVERMFLDIQRACSPEFLHIQAFYTRRGGLDINPFRSTDPAGKALGRLNRQ